MSGWKFHWGHADFSDPLNMGKLLIGRQLLGTADFYVARPLKMVKAYAGSEIQPTVDFRDGGREQFQQALMDSLWEQGVRPSDFKATAEAAQKHLEDMRKIVAHTLNMQL